MLVPNSNADYRALIGDRDAEDTTDLSDNASEEGENEEIDAKSDTKRILDSKHIIGGKPKFNDMVDMADIEPDSLTSMDGVMDFDSLDGTQTEEIDNITHAVNDKVETNDKLITITNIKEEKGLLEPKNSVLIVSVDSGPLSMAEFGVEEIHRTVMNGIHDKNENNFELNKHCYNESANKENYEDANKFKGM